MRRFGKLVIMIEREYDSFAWLNDDIQNEVKWWHEQSARMDAEQANRRKERKAAFLAGKFHAAGGYAHALKELRGKVFRLEQQVTRYKPIGEIFQPSEALVALIQDVNGVSDADAAADFEIVGQQVRRERATT